MKTSRSNLFYSIAVLALGGLLTGSCSTGDKQQTTSEVTTDAAPAAEWITLFDGTSTDGWRAFNDSLLPANWLIEEGTLKSEGMGGDIGGDIVYGAREFDNFELELEWKISAGGNSGIFYHVKEGEQYKAPYETGPEYQVIDDLGFEDPLEEWQKLGADYGMYVAEPGTKIVKAAGEWNSSRIVFTAEKAEYWLNGQKLFEFVPWSEDWTARRNDGKWDDYPDYGTTKTGYIGLQDHGYPVWFRNIRIKAL
ncbi:MAG: DUF1080 domain-containing protein [Cyclobacteriaceae bacterium]|nr:DUF1080 domain-containing protein [Cyclobacteriaceae bacterium]